MESTPQREHHWLNRLVGEWTQEVEAQMGPEQPTESFRGSEVVRSLGGLWTIGEGQGEMPEGGMGLTIMTLGYDPQQGCFLGTFIGSMMAHLWIYRGTLDAAEKVLTLDTEGPNFTQDALARYQDIIEFIDDDHRTLTSRILGDDGVWQQFMTAHYRRQK